MKKRNKKGTAGLLLTAILAIVVVMGCGRRDAKTEPDENTSADNIVITETGEVLEKEDVSRVENMETENQQAKAKEEAARETPAPEPTPEMTSEGEVDLSKIKLTEPEQEQVITEEDQTEPTGRELQIVFLGDSIFDNSRDGTGIPYLTSIQCEADAYNLAIGGTSASIEADESAESAQWTSRSLVGIVNAIIGKIPTDIFAGSKTKEILDNPNIDFSQTDYFVIEYGINDFFRGVAQSDPDSIYNVKTYAGALRYAVANLTEIAPDATIILCSPTYAQFYDGTWMIGDGNSVNTGNGTLFDYKGTCNYVAKETQSVFFNAYQDLGIDGYTAEQYLEDGVHLTEDGRHLYADALAKLILSIEETKNN
ncbi:MAG: SGNH/GDSL hydrolase family protein [Lachnospiraceae bacterium]|nr:SGNH/GDSL hydrolase family protein [Lachnospiraceae bacterium]